MALRTRRPTGRAKRIILITLVVLLAAGGVGFAYFAGWFRGELPNRQASVIGDGAGDGSPAVRFEPGEVRVEPAPIALIPPGTVVGDAAPEGWTHLVIKTKTRIGSGDVEAVNPRALDLISFLSTALLARVGQRETDGAQRYYLQELGYGYAVDIDGPDTIISSDTHKELGANLGVWKGIAVSKAEERLPEMLVVARGDTFAIYDCTTYLRRNNANQQVTIRQVLLVDPTTGDFHAAAWAIAMDGEGVYQSLATKAFALPPNFVVTTVMHVDASHVYVGIPTEAALASSNFGEGMTELPVASEAADLLAKQKLTPADAAAIADYVWNAVRKSAGE